MWAILFCMISFRTACPKDAPALSHLVNSAYRGDSSKAGWTTEADLLGGQRTDADKILEMIESQTSQIEIAFDSERSDDILGCVYLNQENIVTLYFGMLTVNPAIQAQGLGKLLLSHLESVARDKGYKKIRMTVISVRKELIAFYERRGYWATGVTEVFPANDPRFGIPKVSDLEFLEFIKEI